MTREKPLHIAPQTPMGGYSYVELYENTGGSFRLHLSRSLPSSSVRQVWGTRIPRENIRGDLTARDARGALPSRQAAPPASDSPNSPPVSPPAGPWDVARRPALRRRQTTRRRHPPRVLTANTNETRKNHAQTPSGSQ